ncbi:DUF86 domain-containing protein [Thiohalophilus sp.]|uniref:HepT-like ribonuclease domain-containing protein n=1 Tax=Thiohalophilus sp. TaxID=3028392 RepID=UPI002ACDE25F|nr:HepT-like ribonuclease domain-containing protein [Thiohalophilus sp.]MDZ7804366.1 HepT-like ribonuclease domain-containing protein [Thiohalophilus sp.]
MRREPEKYLHDIWVAGSRVQQFVHKKDYSDYLKDELLRAGVERQFEIMGEALNQLARVSPDMVASIPEYKRIIAFRNILIHGYADVDDALVWGVVEGKLPGLMQAVSRLLDEKNEPK